jgi:SAM-dependent MidA family methyltransferase
MLLHSIIAEKILKEGPVSFKDFMDMCLYYPGQGYYETGDPKIGRNGDFFTSSCLTPAFGAMIGRQIVEMWNLLDRKKFSVVEFGAGPGMLARDILDYLKDHPAFFDMLDYYIIEKSPVMRQAEKAILSEKVTWLESIDEIGEVKGCILSNELLDNFPVHQVLMGGELLEVFVGYDSAFYEVLRPAGPRLVQYFKELEVVLPAGFRTEVNMEAIGWMKEISKLLKQGFVLTIDFGYLSSGLYQACHSNGTLVCYKKHQVNFNPYENPGTQDITSQVNFSALDHWGRKFGLQRCFYGSQACFLMAQGIESYLDHLNGKSGSWLKEDERNRLIKKILLSDMGKKYRVLLQQKNGHAA